jgi:NAD(P)H-dependent FMN reductase
VDRIGIILGSTRPNRNGEQVARWVLDVAKQRTDAEFELVDLRDYPLPHLDEPVPPSMGQYRNDHTKQWAAKIASFDGFVFVTPEYNHSTSGVLKNAIDYLYAEWNNKAAGFVSYGSVGGARAAEHLRLIAGELQIADVRQQVALSLSTEFENYTVFKPRPNQEPQLATLLDQVVAWSTALEPLRK